MITPLTEKGPNMYKITCVEDDTSLVPSTFTVLSNTFDGPVGSETNLDERDVWYMKGFEVEDKRSKDIKHKFTRYVCMF